MREWESYSEEWGGVRVLLRNFAGVRELLRNMRGVRELFRHIWGSEGVVPKYRGGGRVILEYRSAGGSEKVIVKCMAMLEGASVFPRYGGECESYRV